MTSLTGGPFQQVERRAGLVLGTTLSRHRGQARLVCLLASHPGWVYKEYHDTRQQADDAHLDRLIAFPARLPAYEQEILRTGISWPTSRVVADRRTVGVIMPFAPDSFRTTVRVPSGTHTGLLTIDMLALDDAALRRRAIPPQPMVNRVLACSSLATTAELMERHGIVYLDWSFANAFWSPRGRAVYVIDVDGSSFGPRTLIESPGFEDPLVPKGSVGGHPVDRYRVALLVGRCLTTVRAAPELPAALTRLATAEPRLSGVCRLVMRSLTAADPDRRPPIAGLAAALGDAAGALGAAVVPAPRPSARSGDASNVTDWVVVGKRRARPSSAAPSPEPSAESAPAAPATPQPRRVPEPVPVSADPPAPWATPVPVPVAEPTLSPAARAVLVVLGIVLAIVLLLVFI